MDKPDYRITDSVRWQMLAVAGIFDLVSLVPFLNTVTKVFALFIFYVWFKIEGISYSNNPKIMTNLAVTGIIGLIPVISALPEQLWNVMRTITISRMEDEAEFKKKNAVIAQTSKRMGQDPAFQRRRQQNLGDSSFPNQKSYREPTPERSYTETSPQ